MLARDKRLRNSRDISKVYAKGKFGGASHLHAKVLGTGRPDTRLTIVVSKIVSKKAAVRNRNRRRVSGAVESVWATLKPSCDIVISVTADLSDLPAPDINRQIHASLSRGGAIKSEKS